MMSITSFDENMIHKVLSRLKQCNATNYIEVDIGEVKQMMWTDDSFAQREGGSANGLKLLATECPTWEGRAA